MSNKNEHGINIFAVILALICVSVIVYGYCCFVGSTDINILFILLGVSVILPFLVRFAVFLFRRHSRGRKLLKRIDKMSGTEFEEFLADYFRKSGYEVVTTPASNDYVADLILISGDEKTAVQAKRYEAKVGNSAVQEIIAAKGYYETENAMVVTNSYFTANAINLAEANEVELWDRDTLTDIL